MNTIISAAHLSKRYGALTATRDVSFTVKRGELFALLGTNGAGKSTTISILCTLLAPDQGEVVIDGHRLGAENAAIRQKIGVVFQENVLDPLLSVRENLITRARLYHLSGRALKEAVESAAKACNVTEYIDRPYGQLSGGWRRRADIARALVHRPEVLFLDEPTTGLDPQSRAEVWSTLRTLQKQSGLSVLLTTHYLEEAEGADDIIILDHGQIAAHGTAASLKEQYCTDTLKLLPKAERRSALLEELTKQGVAYRESQDYLLVALKHSLDAIALLDAVQNTLASFEVRHGTLNDAFLHIAGGEERHA